MKKQNASSASNSKTFIYYNLLIFSGYIISFKIHFRAVLGFNVSGFKQRMQQIAPFLVGNIASFSSFGRLLQVTWGSQVARPNGGRNLWKIQGKKVPLIIVDSGFQNSPSNLFPPNFQTSQKPKKEKIPRKKWENGLLPFLRDVPLCTLCVLGCQQQGEKGSSFTGIQRISWYGWPFLPSLPGICIHLNHCFKMLRSISEPSVLVDTSPMFMDEPGDKLESSFESRGFFSTLVGLRTWTCKIHQSR